MNCRLGTLEVVVTNVLRPSKDKRSKRRNRDLVAYFSFNLVEPLTGIVIMTCNKFELRGKPGSWKVFSKYEMVYDPYAPEEIPDDQAYKTLFLISFYPKNVNKGKDIEAQRIAFVNSLGDAVINKLQYHRQRNRELALARNENNGTKQNIN